MTATPTGKEATQRPGWLVRHDELHQSGKLMPGPWHWEIHDHSIATLCGGGEDAITGFIFAISPCRACADRAEPKEWKWGRCTVPQEHYARAITAIPEMIAALELALPFVEATGSVEAITQVRAALAKSQSHPAL